MKWLLTILSLLGVILNIYKSPIGFIVWIFTNAAWCYIDFKKGLKEQALLFAVYFMLALYGLYRWLQ